MPLVDRISLTTRALCSKSRNASAIDCNQDGSVNISDVTALIDYLLSNHW